jgi:phage/plasmid-associated DNA primase
MIMQLVKRQYIAMQMSKLGDLEAANDAYFKRWRRHREYRDSIWNDPRQANLLKQLKKSTKLVVSGSFFAEASHDSLLLNFSNGTFDVSTGKLRNHLREDRLTEAIRRELKLESIKGALETDAPKFWSLLWRMCGAPAELGDAQHTARVAGVWRWMGYQCHGSNPEKKMAIFEGATSIGKNQVAEIVGALLGPDLAYMSARAALVVKVKNDRHDSTSNKMIGKRMVLVNELSESQVLDEQQVLTLVNPEGTAVDLRKLGHDSVTVATTWKITVTSNELARADLTPQMLERLLIFPLSEEPVPPKDRRAIKAEILGDERESDAILAHLVQEWRAWWLSWQGKNRTGLFVPADAVARLSMYQEENKHPAAQFLSERCEFKPGVVVTPGHIWLRCSAYYKDQHEDRPARYLGGKRKLFSLIDDILGKDAREYYPGGRFKAFRGIEVLPPEPGSREEKIVMDSYGWNPGSP